jgi:CBS domain-containing protein
MAQSVTLARPYARAAFEVARAAGSLDAWSQSLAFAAAVAGDARVAGLGNDPRVLPAQLVALHLPAGVAADGPLGQVQAEMAAQRGLAVVAEGPALQGVVTTGDLTRLAERQPDFLGVPVLSVMTRTPRTAAPDELAAAAVGRMEQFGIMALPVLEGGRLVGVVHLHDLLRAGAV